MKKQLVRWLLPLVAILVIATVMVLSVSFSMAHASSTTTSHRTHIVSPAKPGVSVPASVWHG